MNSKMAAILAIAVVAVIAAAAVSLALPGHSKTAPQQQAAINSTQPARANSSGTLFSSTQVSGYSYQIYPGQISPQARAALTGFNMSQYALANGSEMVNISLSGTNQQQSIVLKPGYKLYIIETTFGDDGYHFDSSLGDDGFVMVDPNGYVVQ